MKKLLFTCCFSMLFNYLLGQTTSNTNVQDIRFFTEQQLKANRSFERGYLFVHHRYFKQAIKPLKKAIAIDPSGNCATGDDGVAYNELGYAYLRLGDFENAIIYLDKAIEINKFLPGAQLSKAVILMHQKKYELSLEVLNRLIENVPDYAIGYVQRGFLFETIGKKELALIDFYKFLEIVKEQNIIEESREFVDLALKLIDKIEGND